MHVLTSYDDAWGIVAESGRWEGYSSKGHLDKASKQARTVETESSLNTFRSPPLCLPSHSQHVNYPYIFPTLSLSPLWYLPPSSARFVTL